ncbi:MAG: PIG-L family deacetylase [Coriobacteriia bacterium]|nr:PIG-L family deacetylase [Coriobacteriia bacterium]MCL2537327.1 PIG-L family deacetylase [Coriobacteriia bacterium]
MDNLKHVNMAKLPLYSVLLLLCLAGLLLSFTELGSATAHHSQGDTPVRAAIEADTSPIIVIVPHPDDEAFGFSGVLGSAVAAGSPVRVYLLSDGEHAKAASTWLSHQADASSSKRRGALSESDRQRFGLARRAEFFDSMEALGVPATCLVLMGELCRKGELETPLSAGIIAGHIRGDCLQAGFPLDEKTRIFTVAPQLGDCNASQLYGEQHRCQIPKMHELSARAAALLCSEPEGLQPAQVYFFKVYAHGRHDAQAPIVIPATTESRHFRAEAIGKYSDIGKLSAPRIYRGALKSEVEYASTLQQVRDAGFSY